VVKRRKDFELIGTRSPQDPQVGQLAKQLLVVSLPGRRIISILTNQILYIELCN